MRNDSFASLTKRPGCGPPPITYTAPAAAATPTPAYDVIRVDAANGSARCLSADGDDRAADRGRTRAAARHRHGRLATPAPLARRPRLDELEVRVQSRHTA